MTLVELERILSTRPKIRPVLTAEPCLRDLIFNYYAAHVDDNTANQYTKEYTDKLREIMRAK